MPRQNQLRIVFSGGGTGGHVYPGIAIANKLKQMRPDADIFFVGVKHRIESKIVPREGYPLKFIHVQYLTRKLGLQTITFFFSLLIGLVQALILLIRIRPQVVIGTGGYVSGPVVYAAHLLGIPTLIQEQNSYPGITTRILASHVDEIHLAFKEAIQYLPRVTNKNKINITGNPIRLTAEPMTHFSARKKFDLDPNKRTLLLFGGSQGATPLNQALIQALPYLSPEIQIIWQTGESDFANVKATCQNDTHQIFIQPFIHEMAEAYAAADLALCRAGAITIAELVQVGVPAIFVPLPHAAEGHQEKNARVLTENQAAEMILQQDLSGSVLKEKIEQLIFDDAKLTLFKQNLKKFLHPNAADAIANSALQLAVKKN